MYATSKLIIPAKIAQDSPYVPKIRICLRPSPLLEKDSNMGSSLGSAETFGENPDSQDIHGDIRLTGQGTDALTQSLQETPKNNRKRKLSSGWEAIDFESRDSPITRVNLKKLINMETFRALPSETQRYLMSLLPVYDQVAHPDSTDGASESSSMSRCWIHSTALNNEFLSKSLQDYSSRQMKGGFSPRFNYRRGLRKSVGNRQRYSNLESPQSSGSFMRTPMPQHVAQNQAHALTKDEQYCPPATISPSNMNGTHTNEATATSPISRLRTRSTTSRPTSTILSSPSSTQLKPDKTMTDEGIAARLSRKRKRSSDTIAASNVITYSSASSSSPSPPCPPPSSSSPSSGHSPNNNIVTSTPSFGSPPARKYTLADSTARRPSMPRLESTLLHQNGLPFPSETTKPSSVCSLPGMFHNPRRPTQNPSGVAHHPLVMDSLSPTVMPPPRETKTLASVRERLRAKRIMMGQNQSSPSGILAPLPPPAAPQSLHPLPNASPAVTGLPSGSLTPDPGATASGNIYSCPQESTNRQYHHNHHHGPVHSAPMFLNPNPRTPSATVAVHSVGGGGSVSAPPTPQHGAAAVGPLPAFLANLKQARVVVAPSTSISGSSVCSGDSCGGVTETPAAAVYDSSSCATASAIAQSVTEPATVPTNSGAEIASPVTASAVSSTPGTTTRAFIVDGSNLTETLALLQSMIPQATVTQQQFFLIPTTDKSHAILCRPPLTIQPRQVPTPSPPSQPSPATGAHVVMRRSSTSGNAVVSTAQTLPLLLPASRAPSDASSTIPTGMFREILPNRGQSRTPRVAPTLTSNSQQVFFAGSNNQPAEISNNAAFVSPSPLPVPPPQHPSEPNLPPPTG